MLSPLRPVSLLLLPPTPTQDPAVSRSALVALAPQGNTTDVSRNEAATTKAFFKVINYKSCYSFKSFNWDLAVYVCA